MTVKELITELKRYPEDCKVYACDGHNRYSLDISWKENNDVVFLEGPHWKEDE